MAKLQRAVVKPTQTAPPIGAYSHAIRIKAGELIFVAGQVALDAKGNLVGKGDAAAQTRQALENIGGVLAGAGATFANVVEFTTYVVGRESVQGFIKGRGEVFPKMFPGGDYPCNTLLVIEGLVRPEFLVEIKAVAALP